MRMHPIIKTYFLIFAVILIVSNIVVAEENRTSENVYGRLTALQCDSLIKANETNPNFVILDVRTPLEWDSYHIMGSINRSTGLSDFTAQLDALPKQKTFLLHCQSGGRSAGAFQKMKDLKFAEVYEMIGGINSWNSKGLPTTKITEPKLMLVSHSEILKGNSADTINVTITNRANGNLTFGVVSLSDIHIIENNFNHETVLEGAQDYTFSIVHSPVYSGLDSTRIRIESNGGLLEMSIVYNNGIIQGAENHPLNILSIYPNPANQKLYFKAPYEFVIDELSAINLYGQTVLKEKLISNKNSINVSGLKNGIYILQMKTDGKVISKKFIVKH